MRRGIFPGRGNVEDLTATCDAVLVWTGDAHEVTIRGDSRARPPSTTFVRRSGMIDLLPAGTRLREVRWRGGGATCVSVNLASDTIREFFGVDGPRLDPRLGPRFGVVDGHIVDLVQRLQDQMAAGEPLGAAYVQGLSLTLASYVLTKSDRHRGAGSAGAAPRLDIAAIVTFVEENLNTNLGLVDVARIVGCSPDHFARQFKQTFGLSPYQYILGRRIERAKSLLGDPRRSIVDVALACGFSSQAHLSALFKRSTGMSPGLYRRRR